MMLSVEAWTAQYPAYSPLTVSVAVTRYYEYKFSHSRGLDIKIQQRSQLYDNVACDRMLS